MSALPSQPIGLMASGIFCFFIAVLFIVKGLFPRWRSAWGWGRGPVSPISIFGHLGISVGFLLISIGLFAGYFKIYPNIAFFSPLIGFSIFIFTGVFDSHRTKK
jgi:hypothetical protein